LNEEVVERYTLPRGTPIPDGNYSDVIFGQPYYRPAGPYDGAKSAKTAFAE
jgi:hypothetical protein